jgi:N-acetylmuramoyl-L-alanine amidase
VADPLVEDVRVAEDRVRIELAPETRAESYELERPFRLVFDVVRAERSRSEAEEVPGIEPARPHEGLRTIVIDPGHGGGESGAVGPTGETEKDLTLELARVLRARLAERLPVRVVLTRDEDASLPLDTRSAIANQNKADLFISIHLNSSLGARARGAETYFLSMEASDARAAEVAAAENRGAAELDDPLHDLQLILWDLAQSHHLSASQRVAALIQEELNTTLGLRDRGVKQAPFRVLMGAAMPAVLVELGFLSNPEEEERLKDPAYRSELVEALVRAIGRYRSEVDERAARARAQGGPGEAAEPTP